MQLFLRLGNLCNDLLYRIPGAFIELRNRLVGSIHWIIRSPLAVQNILNGPTVLKLCVKSRWIQDPEVLISRFLVGFVAIGFLPSQRIEDMHKVSWS